MLPAVMSANEHTETVFECIREGAEDYLLKPVTKKEVQNIWQHVWRRQQQAAQSSRTHATVSPGLHRPLQHSSRTGHTLALCSLAEGFMSSKVRLVLPPCSGGYWLVHQLLEAVPCLRASRTHIPYMSVIYMARS